MKKKTTHEGFIKKVNKKCPEIDSVMKEYNIHKKLTS